MRSFLPLILAFFLVGCAADTNEDENNEFFLDESAADQSRPYRIVPASGAIEVEPNDELLEERLWFEPYVVEQGETENDIHIYREDDAWYEMRRYIMTVEEPGNLRITTESQSNILIDLWQVLGTSNQRVESGMNYLSYDITVAGRYGIITEASSYPVITAEEDAYIDYILRTTFTPAQ